MSKTIDSTAKKYASYGTEITTLNPPDGPDFIANAYHATQQAPKVVDLIEKNISNYACFIIACGVDPGLEACRLVTKHVIGAGEAAIMTACAVARRFSFLTPLKGGVLARRERLRCLGIDQSRCASVRVVGSGIGDEIVRKRNEMFEVYCQVSRKCIDEDGAGALVLTCAGMSDLKERLEKLLKIPVFSGVESAVKIVEQLPTQ
jgi:allantoin racemase